MTKRIVIIPTYNEKENILSIISTVLNLPDSFDVLVVDDSSPDGTGHLVKNLQKTTKGLFLLTRLKKEGLGRAYIAGFKWCLEREYEYILEMDADFSHPPEKLITLSHICESDIGDIAVGSRYVKNGQVKNWGWYRLLLSSLASVYVRMITWMPVKDPTAGFVCYKRKVLEDLNLDEIQFNGYAFQIEMKYKSYKKGYRIIESPIIFKDRVLGKSKLSTGIIKEAALGVLKLRFG